MLLLVVHRRLIMLLPHNCLLLLLLHCLLLLLLRKGGSSGRLRVRVRRSCDTGGGVKAPGSCSGEGAAAWVTGRPARGGRAAAGDGSGAARGGRRRPASVFRRCCCRCCPFARGCHHHRVHREPADVRQGGLVVEVGVGERRRLEDRGERRGAERHRRRRRGRPSVPGPFRAHAPTAPASHGRGDQCLQVPERERGSAHPTAEETCRVRRGERHGPVVVAEGGVEGAVVSASASADSAAASTGDAGAAVERGEGAEEALLLGCLKRGDSVGWEREREREREGGRGERNGGDCERKTTAINRR